MVLWPPHGVGQNYGVKFKGKRSFQLNARSVRQTVIPDAGYASGDLDERKWRRVKQGMEWEEDQIGIRERERCLQPHKEDWNPALLSGLYDLSKPRRLSEAPFSPLPSQLQGGASEPEVWDPTLSSPPVGPTVSLNELDWGFHPWLPSGQLCLNCGASAPLPVTMFLPIIREHVQLSGSQLPKSQNCVLPERVLRRRMGVGEVWGVRG